MDLKKVTLQEVIDYNKCYDRGDFRGSEATRKDVDALSYFINEIRPTYTYTEQLDGKNWVALDIAKGHHTKYGDNYIYIDHTRKLWRTKQTISEFYGGGIVD